MPELIETKNIRTVKSAVREAVNENGFLAVIADVGSGKTAIFNDLKNFWSSYPNRFSVVDLKEFKMKHSRISVIMELLILACDPGASVPQPVEKRYIMLRDVLRTTKKKVILTTDEAQDFNFQTFRDLKKIHEIDSDEKENLFSIILFGKTDRQWNRVLAEPELGYRISFLPLDDLAGEEIIQIAEKRFKLSFQNERIKERFCARLPYKTPLGIKFAGDAIRMMKGLDKDSAVIVDAEAIQKLPYYTIKIQLKQLKLKQVDAMEYCKAVLPGRGVNNQRYSEFMNGKLENESLQEDLMLATESFIHHRFSGKGSLRRA